jgi:two-component system chemotaxis response regulator CheB
MPRSALQYVTADHVTLIHGVAPLLNRLTQEPAAATEEPTSEELKMETRIALDSEDPKRPVLALGELTPFTCPDCHGVLSQLKEGGIPRFRCHTGHAYSFESLRAETTRRVEDSLWDAIRSIEENVLLLKKVASHVRAHGQRTSLADEIDRAAGEAARRADRVREVAMHDAGLDDVAITTS